MAVVNIIALRFGSERGVMPSLGPVVLATALRGAGHEVEVVDSSSNPSLLPFGVRTLAELIRSLRGDVLGFSLFHDSIPLLTACLMAYPDCVRGRRVFVGGPGVTGIELELLRELPVLEAVVRGDGESIFPELISSPETARRRPGVFSRDGAASFQGSGRSPREDLNRFGEFAWDVYDASSEFTAIPISSMRGCPFDCSFCEVIASFGRSVSYRRPSLVAGDVKAASERFGIKTVRLVDDTFNVSREHMRAICTALQGGCPGAIFSAYARVELLKHDDIEFLAAQGCRRLFFGIDRLESDSARRWAKGYQETQVRRWISETSKHLSVSMSMIWGFPDESLEQFMAGFNLARDLMNSQEYYAVWPQYSLLSPSVETAIYSEFSPKLVLDLDSPLLPLGQSLRSATALDADGPAVLDLIKRNPRLGAAFYRFSSPSFEKKAEKIAELAVEFDIRVGRELKKYLKI